MGARTGRATGNEPEFGRFSLGWLVSQLGARVASVVCAPGGLDAVVRDPVIYDAVVAPAVEPGDLVLGIGIVPSAPEALDLVQWAGSRDVGAAVFKAGPDGLPDALVAAADAAGVALVAIRPETAWDQFYALVRRVMATVAELTGGDEATPVGDVFALANAIAAMVGGAVVINDPQLQVIAYSSLDDPIDETRRLSILGRRPPEELVRRLRDEGVLRSLYQSHEAIPIPAWAGPSPRIAVAIRAGKELLGYIFVAEGKAPLGDGARHTLLEASRIAALHLLRLQSSQDLERRQRSDLLRGVLEGRGSIDLLAARLGLPLDGAFTVVGYEFDDHPVAGEPADEEDLRFRRRRARDLVRIQSEALLRRSATASLGAVVYTLLPGTEALPQARFATLAHDVVETAERAHGIRLLAGIGSTVKHLRAVADSRRDADRVLRLLKGELTGRRVATIAQVGAHAFLGDLREVDSLRAAVAGGKVAALLAIDHEQGTPYVETLRAYLDALGDVAAAAKAVHVHRNTLRYRLRRLCELVDLDLDDPTERLVAELHLRLLAS